MFCITWSRCKHGFSPQPLPADLLHDTTRSSYKTPECLFITLLGTVNILDVCWAYSARCDTSRHRIYKKEFVSSLNQCEGESFTKNNNECVRAWSRDMCHFCVIVMEYKPSILCNYFLFLPKQTSTYNNEFILYWVRKAIFSNEWVLMSLAKSWIYSSDSRHAVLRHFNFKNKKLPSK
jgi:hypothetical protein